jgi:hypothetical protein
MQPHNRRCFAGIGAVLLSCTLSATVFAAEVGPSPRQACAADAHSLCQGIKPGGGRIKACIRDHASQLSEGCKAAIEAHRAGRQQSDNRQMPVPWARFRYLLTQESGLNCVISLS